MAYNQQQERTYTARCSEDLSTNQFQFVALGTDERVKACGDSTYALGILTDVPSPDANGQYCATVAVDGITRLSVGKAYAAGTFVVPHTDGTSKGYGYSVADAASSEQYIRAYTLQASAAAYDVVPVKLIDPRPDLYSRGATGLMGPAGATGILGLQGVTGLALGATGIQGIDGQTGIQGLTGIYGLTGIQGETGIQGLTGLGA